MVEIKALADADRGGVDVEASYNGMGIDVFNESVAVIKSIYDDSKKHGFDEALLATLGDMLYAWVAEYNEDGENLD